MFTAQRSTVHEWAVLLLRLHQNNGHFVSATPKIKATSAMAVIPSHHEVITVHWGRCRRILVMPAAVPLHTIAAFSAMVLVCKVIKFWKVCETARKMMDGAPRSPLESPLQKIRLPKNERGHDPFRTSFSHLIFCTSKLNYHNIRYWSYVQI